MKQKIFLLLILTFALWLPLNAKENTHQPYTPCNPYNEIANLTGSPSSNEESAIRDGVSYAVPVDLLGVDCKLMQLPSYARGAQDGETSESCRKSINKDDKLVGFKAVTHDYGQLKSILDANNGNEIDSLVVVGPMNKADLKAIWDCAVYGNMQVLNLENATMENNAIPDYALYDPIQFESGFWLKYDVLFYRKVLSASARLHSHLWVWKK